VNHSSRPTFALKRSRLLGQLIDVCPCRVRIQREETLVMESFNGDERV
jgi:hypothetical protein